MLTATQAMVATGIVLARHSWPRLFTDSPAVVARTAGLLPLFALRCAAGPLYPSSFYCALQHLHSPSRPTRPAAPLSGVPSTRFPPCACSLFGDGTNAVLQGLLRGAGRQHLGAITNLLRLGAGGPGGATLQQADGPTVRQRWSAGARDRPTDSRLGRCAEDSQSQRLCLDLRQT